MSTEMPAMSPSWAIELVTTALHRHAPDWNLYDVWWEERATPRLIFEFHSERRTAKWRLSVRPCDGRAEPRDWKWEDVDANEPWQQALSTVRTHIQFPPCVRIPEPVQDGRQNYQQPWRIDSRQTSDKLVAFSTHPMPDAELELLRTSFDDLALVTKKQCVFHSWDDWKTWSVSVPAPLAHFSSPSFIASVHPVWLERRIWRDYLHGLGYSADSQLRMLTVPSPASFDRRRRAMGLAQSGMRVKVVSSWRPQQNSAQWLSTLLDGALLLGVAQPSVIRAQSWVLERSGRICKTWGDTHRYLNDAIIAHDMAVHAFAFHRIGSSAISQWITKIQNALPKGWQHLGPAMDNHIPRFFEETLTVACRDFWSQASSPEDFDRLFDNNLSSLCRELDQALERMRAQKKMVFLGIISARIN